MNTSKLISLYLANLFFFLGIGLFGGSLVHITRDPVLYWTIAAIWLWLFLIWSYIKLNVEYKHLTLHQVLSVMIASFFFAWGVGVVSWAIQHFTEIWSLGPRYISLGIPFSLFAFRKKEQISITAKQWKMMLIGWIITSLILFFISNMVLSYLQAHPLEESWHHSETVTTNHDDFLDTPVESIIQETSSAHEDGDHH